MSETHSMMRVKRTDYICDHCGEGRMVNTGYSWLLGANKVFAHRCEVCGVQVALSTPYPRTEFVQEASQ
jgi:hypothetical protein